MKKLSPRVVAACLAVALAFTIAGCDEGGELPGEGPAGTPADTVDTVVVTQDSEAQSYALRGGRYRVSWNHQCDEVGVLLQQANGEFVYERTTSSRTFSAIVSDVPAGEYEFTQTEAGCEQYEIRLDRL